MPRLALAVSGGADSTALALLAAEFCADRGGAVLALIADHGLREGSAAEAALTASRLAARGIHSEILRLDVAPGAGLQARARLARHAALARAAAAAGFVFLALGHHAADQAETVFMRAQRGPGGEEGMAAWSARQEVVLLRPLLGVDPALLRDFLRAEGMGWVEDPSNQSPRFERVRIRQGGGGAMPADAAARRAAERALAAFLARHVEIRPEGFAVLAADRAPPAALASLLRTIGGRVYPPGRAQVAALAEKLRPATLGGVRLAPAGRLGAGWLLVREAALCAPPVPALCHALWDGRFTLLQGQAPGWRLGALGAGAAAFRFHAGLPSLVLRAMPALYAPEGGVVFPAPVLFTPPLPLAGAPFGG